MDERERIAALERRVAELQAGEERRQHVWVARYLARERRAKRIMAAYCIVGALTGANVAYQLYWPPWRLPWSTLAFAPITVSAIIMGGIVAWPLWWAHLGWERWQDKHDPRRQLERQIDERRQREGLPPLFS